ncbi:MAG TPA: hypothetical protein VGS22_27540 [Thermoanaerobaculia bacterium]|nr:hypothetical protein [Thermoanaerobaculia bacterium]
MKPIRIILGAALLAFVEAAAVLAQPKLVVKSFTIANGAQSPTVTLASGQYSTASSSYTASYVYYIFQNTGNQTLTMSVPNYLGCTAGVWSCESIPATILAGQTKQISMLFLAGASGVQHGANRGSLTVTTNTSAGVFVLNFQAIYVGDPSMTIVSGDNINVTSGFAYQYPSTPVGVPVSRVFTFANNTPENFVELNVYNYTLTQIQGNCFSLIAGTFPVMIFSGSPLNFRWRMMSGAANTCKAKITFNTNKAIYPSFSWTISGTVTP